MPRRDSETPIRNRLKGVVEAALVTAGLAALARTRVRHRALILAWHNILPDDQPPAGDRSLHLPRRAFAAQLDILQATHDIVPLAALVQDPGRSRRPAARRPRVALTFDDAYEGAVTCGVAELVRRGLPATIFVPPAFVDGGTFWWDACAPDTGWGEADRAAALGTLRGEDTPVRNWVRARGGREQPVLPVSRGASLAALGEAARRPGITLGAHSWGHPNLTRLDAAELDRELRQPLVWLRERFGGASDVLAYPYGLASPTVARAARDAGYRAGVLVTGGWLGDADDPFHLPRLNVPAGLSPNGFALRAAGVWSR